MQGYNIIVCFSEYLINLLGVDMPAPKELLHQIQHQTDIAIGNIIEKLQELRIVLERCKENSNKCVECRHLRRDL